MVNRNGSDQKSAVKAVMDYVQQGIRENSFGGGRLPSEQEIAEIVSVSRTPVREAMKILDATGVIEIRRGIGTFVSPQAKTTFEYLLQFQTVMQSASPQQLFEARVMVEQTAAELAAAARSPEDILRIRGANEKFRKLAEMPDVDLELLADADIEFHKAVFDVCGNPLIATIGKLTVEQVRPWLGISYQGDGPSLSVQIHECLIEAIEKKDTVNARQSASARAVWEGLSNWQERLTGN